MTINELLPFVVTLSNADKFRLLQIIIAQLSKEVVAERQQAQSPTETFDPRHYFGVAHQTRQVIDEYLLSIRENWRE
jgi:hypothetical protein